MKLSRVTVIGMVVVGVLFAASLAALLIPQFQTTKTAAVTDDKHCPVCGRELPSWAQKAGECPYCKAEGRDGDIKLYREGGSSLVLRLAIPIALVCGFVILLSTHIVLLVRARVVMKPDEVIYHMYCTKCRRKLRYRDRQIGRLGRCPMCGKPIIFPKPRQLAPESKWGKMKRWLRIGSP
jgi:predicted RNA-binding Zn-ribbon protein involved in translation (DUF1610 family)